MAKVKEALKLTAVEEEIVLRLVIDAQKGCSHREISGPGCLHCDALSDMDYRLRERLGWT